MSQDDIMAVGRQLAEAVARGDAAGAAELYAEDAWFLAPNLDALKGRAAIQQFFQGVIDLGVNVLAVDAEEIEILGDTAIEIGTYRLCVEGGVEVDRGKFVAIWKRRGGRWQFYRDIINTSLPTPE